MKSATLLFCLGLTVILNPAPQARAAFPTVALKPVCLQQIHSPTTITYAPDGSGRLFVCDELGKIYIIQGGMLLPTPFLDISATAANVADRKVINVTTAYGERGLLCLAFHPGYANPASPGYRKFYLNYDKPYVSGTDAPPLGPLTGTNAGTLTGNCVSVIAEFQVSAGNPNVAVPSSERRLLLYTQPQSNHNGGQVEFGPEIGPGGERYLYIGVGDGGSQEDNNLGHNGGDNTNPRPTNGLGNAQDKTRLFGKILRIDPFGTNGPGGQYGIPVSNPFVGAGGGVREEIFSYGMRNPWKFSFDKRPGGTNRLFCGDVGGDRTEEVDIIVSGGNYGWRYKEGVELPLFSSGAPVNPLILPPAEVAAMINPIARYAHQGQTVESPALPQLGLSVTGGYVYRGAAIPALQGKYVFGDYGNTSTALSWDSPLMGLEETAPLSGVFTLTQAIPLFGRANPIVGQRILCFGEDESGEIYIGMKTNAGVLQLDGGLPAGGIYKIVPVQTGTVTLPSSQDNSIFSEDAVNGTFLSDARGYLYAGSTGPNTTSPYLRRALVSFNLTSAVPAVPAGAVVQSAQVKLKMNKSGPASGGTTLALHRLTETWGEGSSAATAGTGATATAGDATWTRRFYNTNAWTTAGGKFQVTASATSTPATLVTFGTTALLQSDVQGWLNNTFVNAGWIVRGDEATEGSAVRFDSKDLGGTPPVLVFTYVAAPQPTHFESWIAQYFPSNLVGQYVDPNGDPNGNTIGNLVEYAYGFSPVSASPAASGLQVTSADNGTNTVITVTFRRDPLATDLTYDLQTSGDLLGVWSTITSSVAGDIPFGSGYVTENDIGGEEPIRLVTVQETVPSPANRFVRLRVSRAP